MSRHPCPAPALATLSRGFTLIEVMIAVAIVAVLASVAYPAYQDSIRKGRRAEAFTALSALQQAQERWRSNNASYTNVLVNTSASGVPPNGLNIAATTASGLYTIGVDIDSDSSSTSYTATATAVSGSSQARDGNCSVLGVQLNGGTLKYGSGASSIDWSAANPDAGKCWAR